jgi:putative ABC transport system permease protein
MNWRHDLISIWRRLLDVMGRRRRAREVDDELAFHLAMRREEHERAGVSPDQAARAARQQFGNVAALKEQTREMWTFPSMDSLIQDVRYAFRTLLRSPGFSVVTILVLAIGIGANTAMFSLVNAMLLRGLPYPDADRLVVLIGNVQRAVVERRGNSYPDHLDWRARATMFADMAAYQTTTMTLMGFDEPERISIETVSAPYFAVLGVSPAYGRTFKPEEDQVPNRDAVVILSDALWRRRFGADPSIVNRTIQSAARTYTVVGIMPPGFTGISDSAQLWIPFALSGASFDNRGSRGFQTVARLKPDATIDQARAELDVISKQLERQYPETNEKRAVEISPLSVETFGQLQPVVLTLMAAVSFVLLIACANVANLLIGRSETRQREIAVRSALGAGQSRLLRQLITESCVLTMAGAAAGVAFAQVSVKALTAASPVTFPSFVRPGMNIAVLAFTIGVALVCGLLLGLAPAMHTRSEKLGDALKESARGSTSARSHRLRASLVVAEVALAIMLLVGAGLMIRSVQKLTAVDPGFNPEGLLTLNASIPRQPAPSPPAPASATPAATPAVGQGGNAQQPPPPFVASGAVILEHVRAVPGVTAVSLASDVPLGGSSSAVFYSAEGDSTSGAQTMPRAYVHRVTPEFFETLGMPIKAGRTFLETDATPDGTTVIVSEGVTRRFWPNRDPIGKRIKFGAFNSPNPWLTIVGVVGEVKYRGLPSNPTGDPDLYFPALDRSVQGVLIRASVDPASVTSAVRAALRAAHPSIVVYNVSTMADLVKAQTAASTFTTWILGLFATTALVLSVIGIYGVMSYLVAQRTREFGIRLALGAQRREIIAVVLRHGGRLILVGAAIGIAGSLGLSRLLGGLLFGVTPIDASAALAVLVLVTVAILACLVPAFRATRVDPVDVLRG